MANINTSTYDEIDFIQIIKNLWKQKKTIGISTLLLTTIGILYTLIAPPIYEVSAQLALPTTSNLNEHSLTTLSYSNPRETLFIKEALEKTLKEALKEVLKDSLEHSATEEANDEDKLTVKKIFSSFLSILESNDHKIAIAKQHGDLATQALGIIIDENFIKNLSRVRQVVYPNTTEKTNAFTPDNYLLVLKGVNREHLKALLKNDLKMATNTASSKVKKHYISKLDELIKLQTDQQNFDIKSLKDAIESRKDYLLRLKEDRITELNEAINIASILELQTLPNSGPLTIQTNAEGNQSPLYMRGTKLLKAEIKNLEARGNKVYLDKKLRSMESGMPLLLSNNYIDQLKQQRENLANSNKQFILYNKEFDIPEHPIQPNRALIILVSLALGLTIGIIIAGAISMFKKDDTNKK